MNRLINELTNNKHDKHDLELHDIPLLTISSSHNNLGAFFIEVHGIDGLLTIDLKCATWAIVRG